MTAGLWLVAVAVVAVWYLIRLQRKIEALRAECDALRAERDVWRADHDQLLAGVREMSAWDRAHPRKEGP